MKRFLLVILAFSPQILWACDTPVCQVDPNSLALTQIITFEDQQANMGPGRLLNDLLVLPGAIFAERFHGQTLAFSGNHDLVHGPANAPLTPLAGQPGQTMSLVMMGQNRMLNGYGPAAFPRREGQGEGAISVLFDADQPALAFDLRGGEGGLAQVQFLRRDGSIIIQLSVQKVSEYAVGFERKDGVPDIAGFVLMNVDPQGLAIDNLRFGPPAQLS
jgi:hypothetical protein